MENKSREELILEVASLRLEKGNLEDALLRAKQAHVKDITTISEALIQEAEERDWCETYDEFVSDLNLKLNVQLTERTNDYEVDVVVTQTIRRTQTVRIQITSNNIEGIYTTISDYDDSISSELSDYEWYTEEVEDESYEVESWDKV